MSQTAILPSVVMVRSSRATPATLPVLIAVPTIETVRGTKGFAHCQLVHGPAWQRRRAVRKPRRRLRRHIRLSACALLGLTPLAIAACWARSSRPASFPPEPMPSIVAHTALPDRVCLSDAGRPVQLIDRAPATALDRGKATLQSIETSGAATAPEAEEVVVFPGYVLPDNTRGEPVHEGS